MQSILKPHLIIMLTVIICRNKVYLWNLNLWQHELIMRFATYILILKSYVSSFYANFVGL